MLAANTYDPGSVLWSASDSGWECLRKPRSVPLCHCFGEDSVLSFYRASNEIHHFADYIDFVFVTVCCLMLARRNLHFHPFPAFSTGAMLLKGCQKVWISPETLNSSPLRKCQFYLACHVHMRLFRRVSLRKVPASFIARVLFACINTAHTERIFVKFYIGDMKICRENPHLGKIWPKYRTI